ncbi:MAG: UDP-2,3-diacylglucosamine diphosphatase LpxI [Candidatus Omnitrophica bacterium]|nr:UDP-2,3-diacylglucosamine diphosphatase LpxI [Candidatus Omnitrophota bacterium]
MEKIGLIAGNRRFPIVFSQAAKAKNYDVVAVAIRGDTSPKLSKIVEKIYWIKISEFSKLFEIFKKEGIRKVVMAGQISPWRLFSKEVERSPEIKNLLTSIKDKRADSIFGAIAQRLESGGFELLGSTTFLEDLLPAKGVLTDRQPSPAEWEDVHFGLSLAKEIADLDIGQTVAVKDKAIVAVEALEGTDNLIRRSARICRSGFTVVKVSKPKQDIRFDIPVVGLNTIKNLIRSKASCLAIEAGHTLFIDKAKSIALADRRGISIIAV